MKRKTGSASRNKIAGKRTARVLEQFYMASVNARAEVISRPVEGGYKIRLRSDREIMLPESIARQAIADGLLCFDAKGNLHITDELSAWLKRKKYEVNHKDSGPSAFSCQHLELQEHEIFDPAGDLVTRQVNVGRSVLLRLVRAGEQGAATGISELAFAAGERLREDYNLSRMGQISGSNWTNIRQKGVSSNGSVTAMQPAERSLDAKHRVMMALKAVGPGLDHLVFKVVIREQSLGLFERENNWKARSSTLALQNALQLLARHYGLLVK